MDGLSEAVPGVHPLRLGINLIPPLSDYYPFQSRQVPFLFLTALSSAEMLATLPESEQPHILKKPVDYDELADAIRARLA